MDKIASPQALAAELRTLLAYAGSEKPSREKLAADLRGLADRTAEDFTKNWLSARKQAQKQLVEALMAQFPDLDKKDISPLVEKAVIEIARDLKPLQEDAARKSRLKGK
jgi:hypothetical protein